MDKETHEKIQLIAIRCMNRLRECPDYSTSNTSKRNASMCINYFIGAASLADIVGEERLFNSLKHVILCLSVSGVRYVQELSERFWSETQEA